jgi:hypothetical protein
LRSLQSQGLSCWPGSRDHVCICSRFLVSCATFAFFVSGITSSAGEQCVVTSASGIQLESCLDAIAAGDGREVMQLDKVCLAG